MSVSTEDRGSLGQSRPRGFSKRDFVENPILRFLSVNDTPIAVWTTAVGVLFFQGLFSGFFSDKITVFTKQDCLENGIVFDNIRGMLCTTINQTINDLLADETMDEQVIMESLAECYYKDNYKSLDIQPENKKAFDYFRPMAEEYYTSY